MSPFIDDAELRLMNQLLDDGLTWTAAYNEVVRRRNDR